MVRLTRGATRGGATLARLVPLARTRRCWGVDATPCDKWTTPGCGHWISRASSADIRRAARLSSRRRDLVTGGRVRASLLLDVCRQLDDVAASRVIASATARSRLATIVRLSAADRLPARACVYEGLASCCSQGAFTAVDLLAEQQRLDGVCASAERQCLLTSAREAAGSQSVRCWSHRKAVAHYLECRANPWMPHRPWHSKHASARYGEGDIYWATAAIYGDGLQQFLTSRC